MKFGTFRIADLTRTKTNAIAVILLGLTTFFFHHSALSGFWRLDDGVHLAFAAKYSPWQYFFVPEITGKQSNYHFVTPWNVFFYDINLWLFGLHPKGFYAIQLLLLWADSVATFFLIRLWGRASWAFWGSVLFLVGAPTVHAAQELMDGHYTTGLLFAILALICYVYAVRRENKRLLLAGAFFYLLATTCKEVYVPLIGILLFLPEGTFKNRLRYSMPFALVAALYVIWRYLVLGGHLIGGYSPDAPPVNYLDNMKTVLINFWHIPHTMLGAGTTGLGTLAVLLAVSTAYFAGNTRRIFLLMAGLVCVLLPVVPVSQCIGDHERFFFVSWWAFSVYCSILFSRYFRLRMVAYLACAGMLLLAVQTSYREMTASGASALWKCHDAVTRFIVHSHANQVFYDSANVWYPSSSVARPLLEAEKIINPASPERAQIVQDIYPLLGLHLKEREWFGYDDSCQCVKNISGQLSHLMARVTPRNSRNRKLFVDLKYAGGYLTWNIGPYEKGTYKQIWKNETTNPYDYSAATLPARKGREKLKEKKAMDFYILYESPEGWLVYSRLIHFEPKENAALHWSNDK